MSENDGGNWVAGGVVAIIATGLLGPVGGIVAGAATGILGGAIADAVSNSSDSSDDDDN